MNYYEIDRLSNSALSMIDKGIGYYKAMKNEKKEPTDSMIKGSMIHCLILEPECFDERYFVVDGTLTAKIKETYLSENKQAIRRNDYEDALKIRDNLFKTTDSHLLVGGEAEKELFYTLRGLDFKSKLDYLKEGFIVDLKTTADIGLSHLSYSVKDYGYRRQAALYKEACELEYKKRFRFIFCFLETKLPFGVRWIELNPDYMEFGLSEIHRLIDVYLDDLTIPSGSETIYEDYIITL